MKEAGQNDRLLFYFEPDFIGVSLRLHQAQ